MYFTETYEINRKPIINTYIWLQPSGTDQPNGLDQNDLL